MRQVLSVILMVLLPLAGIASVQAATLEKIQQKKSFRICVNRHALPFSESDGFLPGAHIEMAELVARELGVPLDISWVTFRYRAKYTKCDAFMGVAVLGDDEGFVKKTNPYLHVKMYVVYKPGLKIKSLDDLDGLKIATPSASLAHSILVKRPQVELFVSMAEDKKMLDAVVSGRVDAAIVANTGIGWYKKLNPDVNLEIESAEFIHSFNGYPMAIGFRKADEKIVSRGNDILKKITESGELQKIFYKYGLDQK